jgi:hypothetical protein
MEEAGKSSVGVGSIYHEIGEFGAGLPSFQLGREDWQADFVDTGFILEEG